MRTKHPDFEDTFPTLPAGLDQQGRFATHQQRAAEACTEVGAEPDFDAMARFWSAYIAALLVALIAGLSRGI